VLPLVGGQGGLNLGFQLTLLQPGGADYAQRITASPPRFENLAASLIIVNFFFFRSLGQLKIPKRHFEIT
jgi:hypothetical protein